MKQILSSLQDVTLSRIRNPILGAFFLSWIALNIKGVAIFLLNSVPEKITQIKNWQANSIDDLLIPLLLSLVYLLVLPLLQIAYQYIDEGFFQSKKFKIKHQSLRSYYKGMREVNEYKAESDEQRIAKLKEENLLTWPDEKKRISAIALNNKEDFSKKVSELREIEIRVEPALNELHNTSKAYECYMSELSMMKNNLRDTGVDNDSNELREVLDLIVKDFWFINRGECKQASNIFSYFSSDSDLAKHHESYLRNVDKLENTAPKST
ncbi:hypothetical protein AB4270_21840 [Vibrio cyclitrophicus]